MDKESNSKTTIIINKLEELSKKMDKIAKDIENGWEGQRMINTEIIAKIDNSIVKLADVKPTPVKKTTPIKSEEKPVKKSTTDIAITNMLSYLKFMWKTEKETVITRYLSDKIMGELDKISITDPKIKDKAGPAKEDARITWIWDKYIKDNESLKNQIKSDFDSYKEEAKKEKLTPANKEKSQDD